MKLVIVESPTKAKTLSRFLGKNFKIMASMGHLRDLPKKELGIDIEHKFKPTFIDVPGKEEVISKLTQEAKRTPAIILATDPDREGEAIAYHISKLLNDKRKILRIVFHEITKSAIEKALAHPGRINRQLVNAQWGRRILDRLVGYKLSPLLWRKIRRGLSAGRVQSPAVRLIVEREKEIEKFVPQEYWQIEVELKKEKLKTGVKGSVRAATDSENFVASPSSQKFSPKLSFLASLTKIKGQKAEIKNKKQALEIVAALKKAHYFVAEVRISQVKVSPPPPFITSTLQRAGANLFHWSSKKTMREAQQLYEKGLITYHRTDSVNLSQEALAKAKKYILETFGDEYYSGGRVFRTKSKLAQEAHEAIRPTRVRKLKPEEIKRMGNDGLKLFRLIFNRFVSCQMKEQLVERMAVLIDTDKKLQLKATGQKELFDGYKKLYTKKEEEEEQPLPFLEKGENLDLVKVIPEQKFTQPASRYSEGSLIKALEEKGIGRPSTYVPIISTIQSRQYVEKIEGFFHPTTVGETVTGFLLKYFDYVIDYDFTAQMEDDLDAVAQGKKKWLGIIKSFYNPFAKKLKKVQEEAKRVKIEVEKTGKKCPKCDKGEQVIRLGRFGKFLSCSRFPDCDWTAVFVEKVKGIRCPKCKGEIIIRKTKKGRRFFGCSNWPKCNWASWKKPTRKRS